MDLSVFNPQIKCGAAHGGGGTTAQQANRSRAAEKGRGPTPCSIRGQWQQRDGTSSSARVDPSPLDVAHLPRPRALVRQ